MQFYRAARLQYRANGAKTMRTARISCDGREDHAKCPQHRAKCLYYHASGANAVRSVRSIMRRARTSCDGRTIRKCVYLGRRTILFCQFAGFSLNLPTMSIDSSLPLVIVNPKSAGGSTESGWAGVASNLRTHFGAFQVAFTKKHGDGLVLAKRGAESGRTFIIACGGDGTINEVANGILESEKDVELGVLPSGTGGDFRRTLGMPNDSRDAAQALRDGSTKLIDAGKVTFLNHENKQVSRYFLNVASFGLSASIIERVKTTTSLNWLPNDLLRGKTSFALSTLQEVLGLNFITVRVKIDGKAEKSLNTINFCVCNSRFFGGGMKIAPDAQINDGLLDVVNIGDIKTAKIILNAYKLYNGTHIDLAEVKSTKATHVEVSPFDKHQEIHIEIDGELPGRLPATFEIVPNALRVRVPKEIFSHRFTQIKRR